MSGIIEQSIIPQATPLLQLHPPITGAILHGSLYFLASASDLGNLPRTWQLTWNHS